ncbi:MAG: DUF2163 domain-containing protein [Pseudomonadota bacterium]
MTRSLPQSLVDSFATGCTTLCRCWIIRRPDGVRLGFTDHDRDLSFSALTFHAGSGLNGSAVERATGGRADSYSLSGALQSAVITEEDIGAGRYDSAELELLLVDWQNPESRVTLATGRIGEVRRTDVAFEAEVLGLSEQLEQPVGRAYLRRCDLRLGEARCGVNLADQAFLGTGSVTALPSSQRLIASGISGFDAGWFAEGALTWTSGANQGAVAEVKSHLLANGIATIDLWLAPAFPVVLGDEFSIVTGCDKRSETCRLKFANLLNFRGFPHMPGDDFVNGYRSGAGHDGGSLLNG